MNNLIFEDDKLIVLINSKQVLKVNKKDFEEQITHDLDDEYHYKEIVDMFKKDKHWRLIK